MLRNESSSAILSTKRKISSFSQLQNPPTEISSFSKRLKHSLDQSLNNQPSFLPNYASSSPRHLNGISKPQQINYKPQKFHAPPKHISDVSLPTASQNISLHSHLSSL
ncbi:hypothetical protein BB560_006986, partial [Smittium megazygosporum]